jgi:hypothetical protein
MTTASHEEIWTCQASHHNMSIKQRISTDSPLAFHILSSLKVGIYPDIPTGSSRYATLGNEEELNREQNIVQ